MHNQRNSSKPSPRPWLRPSNEEKWAEYRNSGQLKAGDFVPSPSHQSSPDLLKVTLPQAEKQMVNLVSPGAAVNCDQRTR
eukprot:763370-Hanusia_phi.AAC.3